MAFAGAANRIGPVGPQGEKGLDGKDGNSWLSGLSLPSKDQGIDGDFYLHYRTQDVYLKIDGEWIWKLNIKGKKGEKGDIGEAGITRVVTTGSLVSGSPSSSTPATPTSAITTKLTLTNKNEEYFHQLPTDCKEFILRARNIAKLKLSYSPNHLITEDYLSIGLGGYYKDQNLYTNQKIYLSSNKDNTIIEIITFT